MFLYLQHVAGLYNFVTIKDVCHPLKQVFRIYVKFILNNNMYG